MVHTEAALEEPPFTMGKMQVHSGALVCRDSGQGGGCAARDAGRRWTTQVSATSLLPACPALFNLEEDTETGPLPVGRCGKSPVCYGFRLAGGRVGCRTWKPP